MPAKRFQIDVAFLRQMVAGGATMSDLAAEFRCSVGTIRKVLREHGLVAAFGDTRARVDPTPEEIAERAARIRERNNVAYRQEPWAATKARLWREGILQED